MVSLKMETYHMGRILQQQLWKSVVLHFAIMLHRPINIKYVVTLLQLLQALFERHMRVHSSAVIPIGSVRLSLCFDLREVGYSC